MKKTGRDAPGKVPEKEDIAKKIKAEAHAIWLNRQKHGIPGDAVSDWVAAEKAVLGKGSEKKK